MIAALPYAVVTLVAITLASQLTGADVTVNVLALLLTTVVAGALAGGACRSLRV